MRRHCSRFLLLFVFGMFADAGSAQEARDMRLEDAGFVMRPADTPAKVERLRKLPPRKFVARTVNGKRVYYFADPEFCKCVMVGDARAYQAFRDMRAAPPLVPNLPPTGINPETDMVADFDEDLGATMEPNDILSVPF
jgi:hypothetical protein